MSNQKRIQQLEPEARRQQKLHEQCHLDLNRKNRLIKELETESDETVHWIVEAMKDSSSSPPAVAPPNYKPPKLGSDIAFDYGRAASSNRPKCIQVKRLKPVTTRRGQDSARLLEVDENTPPFLVPSKLLRAGKLKLNRIEIASRQSRSGMSPPSRVQYELTKEKGRNWSSNADTTRN